MKTASEMIVEAQSIFEGLKSGELEPKVAAEMNNTIGKMVNLAKTQLEYHTLRKDTPNMPFFYNDASKTEAKEELEKKKK